MNLNWWMKKIKIYNGRTLIQLLVQALTDRCFTHRLGSSLQRSKNWRDMDSAGENDVHKQTCVLALKLALETSLKVHKTKSLLIQMDNIVDLTYFLKMGDTKNLQMVCLSRHIWELLLRKQVTVTAEYLSSGLNRHADIESCRKIDSSEWKLAPSLLQILCVIMERLFFSSKVSYQHPTYEAWRKNPYSVAMNAVSITWNKNFYAFPPVCLKTEVLKKIEKGKTKKTGLYETMSAVVAPSNIEHVDKETSNLSIVRKTTNQSFRTDSHYCNKSNPCISSIIGLWGNLFQRGPSVKAANLISNSRGKSSVSGCKLSRKKWSG